MVLAGARPTEVVKGTLAQPESLREAVGRLSQLPPGAVWAGGVGYDGDFVFACHPSPIRLTEREEASDSMIGWTGELGPLQPAWSREEYAEKVRRAQAWIAAGDIYQVNLAQPFHGHYRGDPLALHLAVRRIVQPPFASFLPWGEGHLVCGSPELFLRMHGREIETRPIKGTRPRGRTLGEDARLREELRRSEKENAELLMITDLERNDLGQICEYGSVRVAALGEVEAHPQIYHLASVVRGRLRLGEDAVGALAACFPGGSITGAPKRRAMAIIAELEGFARGPFCGAFGWFDAGGGVFNSGIRLAEIGGGLCTAYAGAGIVADSDPEAEYEETLLKAAHWETAGALLRGEASGRG